MAIKNDFNTRILYELQNGSTLMELMIAILFLGVTLTPVIHLWYLEKKTDYSQTMTQQAIILGQNLIEEAAALSFADPEQPESFGMEEYVPHAQMGRIAFDDVDDYQIYQTKWGAQKPPRDIWGNPIIEAAHFKRTVRVYPAISKSSAKSGAIIQDVQKSKTDFKTLKVTVSWEASGIEPDSVSLYRTFSKSDVNYHLIGKF